MSRFFASESTAPVYVATHILVINNKILRDVNERRHLILILETHETLNKSWGKGLSYLRISNLMGRRAAKRRSEISRRPANNQRTLWKLSRRVLQGTFEHTLRSISGKMLIRESSDCDTFSLLNHVDFKLERSGQVFVKKENEEKDS